MKEKNETFSEFCRSFISGQLRKYVGEEMPLDLAQLLCEECNANGTLTFDRETAISYLIDWRCDAAEFFEYETAILGENTNPFANPERYMVEMVRAGVENLLNRCDDAWTESDYLSLEVISAIESTCPEQVTW